MNFTLKLFGLLFSCFLVQSVIVGQESFNLEQAIKYSQEHSTRLKIQKLDVQDAKDQIAEYYAIGYPKLGAKVGYSYFINVPTSLLLLQFMIFWSKKSYSQLIMHHLVVVFRCNLEPKII